MYSENLKKLRKTLDISAQKMADNIGVSQGSIVQYESGKREPNFKFISQLCTVLNVNINWLITGQGSMFITAESEPQTEDIVKLVSDLIDKKLRDKGIL